MAVIFESTIKSVGMGEWVIELKDTTDDRVETCIDIEHFAKVIEEMGADYGGDIEVKWLRDQNVLDAHVNEIRQLMIAFEQKMNEEKEMLNQENSDFNPNQGI